MLIIISQKGDKWHIVYLLNGKTLSVLHDTWDELLKELRDIVMERLTSDSNTDSDK